MLNRRVTLDVSDQIAPAKPAPTIVFKNRERTVNRPPLLHERLVFIYEWPGARTSAHPAFRPT
jgi:hypothetical protein